MVLGTPYIGIVLVQLDQLGKNWDLGTPNYVSVFEHRHFFRFPFMGEMWILRLYP